MSNRHSNIERIVLHFAMEAEARGIAERCSLGDAEPLHPALAARIRRGSIGAVEIVHCVHGIDPVHRVDRIGMECAATTAWAAISSFEPCIYINAGTCGGFAQRGGTIARTYLGGGEFLIHDHRIPLPGFDRLGEGRIPAAAYPALERLLGIESGPVSSGSSLDATPGELAFFEREEVVAKDMEAAAIASVTADWGVPFLAVKTVTDLVDHPEPSHDQFLRNLSSSAEQLTDLLDELIRFMGRGIPLQALQGTESRS
ncbi:MAG: hypothetical protein VX641_02015 [Planctomycetota bacterium]|nr:hypothetical protein [Planctomycetota bacterium]